ncbi:CBL-interacting serine/threonine-protein kinase 1 [Dorcoceras hygrometricum]|uniref:CBL-interacting serine/threonine-protein kinase 1 n=1 Tax=Dorcoceras hygrometricum TaxID=472368 RepID=A0A2Z7CRN7_9LAMI|nr:CBL-interacting serine/threonine-protein kinase 1 [Dorcoceras hygrometricum]
MRIRPPEFETSICDAKYHVSLADEGVSFLVVDRIGDIYRSLPRRADVIVTTVGARHKCQQGKSSGLKEIVGPKRLFSTSMASIRLSGIRIRPPIAVVTPIRSTTRSETPSSGCTRSPDEISTNGFSTSSWPETNFPAKTATAAAAQAAAAGEEKRRGG